MAKKHINAKQLATDILGGAADAELMAKYGISEDKLPSLFATLVAKGLLEQSQVDQRNSRCARQEPTNNRQVIAPLALTSPVARLSQQETPGLRGHRYELRSTRIARQGRGFEVTDESGAVVLKAIRKRGLFGINKVELYSASGEPTLLATARKRGSFGWKTTWEILHGDLLLGKWDSPWFKDSAGRNIGWLAVQHHDFGQVGCLTLLVLPLTILLMLSRIFLAVFGGEHRELHMLLRQSYFLHMIAKRPFFGNWRCTAAFGSESLGSDERKLGLASAVLFKLKEL